MNKLDHAVEIPDGEWAVIGRRRHLRAKETRPLPIGFVPARARPMGHKMLCFSRPILLHASLPQFSAP